MPEMTVITVPTGDLFAAFNHVEVFTQSVIERIPSMPDCDVIQTRERAQEMGKAAWRIECACDAEVLKRTHARRGRGNLDTEGIGVVATVNSIAASVGVAPQTIFKNAQIHNTFFGEENTLRAESILQDKQFFKEALASPDPVAAVEAMAAKKAENPFYSTRDAQRDVETEKGGSTFEWYTPLEYVEAARRVMGGIDLDPASNPTAQAHIGAATFYTRAHDGLKQPWAGRVWLNPPYCNPEVDNFIQRVVGEYQAGRVSDAVVLTNNCTDTAWFHLIARACSAICLTRRRIGFWQSSPDEPLEATRQGQAFFYLGPHPERFAREFSPFGLIVQCVTPAIPTEANIEHALALAV